MSNSYHEKAHDMKKKLISESEYCIGIMPDNSQNSGCTKER